MINQSLSIRIQEIYNSSLKDKEKAKQILSILKDDIKIIFHQQNKINNNKHLLDDIYQDCYIQICDYMKNYEYGSKYKCSLYTYLIVNLRWFISDSNYKYQGLGLSRSARTIRELGLNNICYLDSFDNSNIDILNDDNLLTEIKDDHLNDIFNKKYFQDNFNKNKEMNFLDFYIFYLIFYEDLSDSSISNTLRISLNSVKSARRRIMVYLKKNKNILKTFI